MNEFFGVVEVFNCQGAGWCKVGKKNLIHDVSPGTITGIIRAKDVDYLSKVADDKWNGDSIVFSYVGGEVIYLPKDVSIPITLKSREYEVFTVVPVKELADGIKFAPIGLIKMFNAGGAVKEFSLGSNGSKNVNMKVRGCGHFGAYLSTEPKLVTIDSEEVEFKYEEDSGLVTIDLRVPKEELYQWNISIDL